jgi:hypothetical protein
LIPKSITTAGSSKESRIGAWSIAELEILKRGSPAFLLLPASVVMFISSFLLLCLSEAHRHRSGLFMLPPPQDYQTNLSPCRHLTRQKSRLDLQMARATKRCFDNTEICTRHSPL